MSLYTQMVLPRLLDWAMSDPALARYRQEVLAGTEGEVLEIGFGTGLNLPYYPDRIQKITTIDANPGMNKIAQKRIQAARITVDHRVLNGENLPMADCTFDSVVSTWTLCSIAEVLNLDIKLHIELDKRLWQQIIAPMHNRTATAEFELQIPKLVQQLMSIKGWNFYQL